MIQDDFAKQFARNWIHAWNAHDIESIMAHYSGTIHFQSPVIVRVNNDSSGTITGKTELRDYFTKALYIYPDLHFELMNVLTSINSIVLYYKTINEMTTAEYMELDEDGK